MIRDFVAAGLIDHMHIVVVPILLGKALRLWDGLEGIETDYEIGSASAPSGVTSICSCGVSRDPKEELQCRSCWWTSPRWTGTGPRKGWPGF